MKTQTQNTVFLHECVAVGARFHDDIVRLVARDPKNLEGALSGAVAGLIAGFHDEAAKALIRMALAVECEAIRSKQAQVVA